MTTPNKTAAPVTTITKVEVMRPDDAIVVRSKDGKSIARIKTRVSLSVKEGTLVKLFGSGDATTFVVTHPGFVKLAAACNVAVLHPPTITVNGEAQPNPYRDPVTGMVHSRSVALGRTIYGLQVPVERTVLFDSVTSNIVDLISKGGKNENREYFVIMPAERDEKNRLIRPEGIKHLLRPILEREKPSKIELLDFYWSRWAGYPIDAGMAIWVDTSCPDVFNWQREMLNRADKSLRTCQTFSDRNALSAHPALPRQRKFNQAEVTLECVMWYSENGNMSFDQSMMQIDPMKLIEATAAPVDSKVEDISREDPAALAAQVSDAAEGEVVAKDDDDLPYTGKEKEEKAKGKDAGGSEPEPAEDKARTQLLADIEAEEKRIKLTGPIRRARVGAGVGTGPEGLGLADNDQLTTLLSVLKGIKPGE